MKHERLSGEAREFYADHRNIASGIRTEENVLRAITKRAVDLRAGRAAMAYRLGDRAAKRQADVIAENVRDSNLPRLEELRRRYDTNLKESANHFNNNYEGYLEMARAEMEAQEASSSIPRE